MQVWLLLLLLLLLTLLLLSKRFTDTRQALIQRVQSPLQRRVCTSEWLRQRLNEHRDRDGNSRRRKILREYVLGRQHAGTTAELQGNFQRRLIHC